MKLKLSCSEWKNCMGFKTCWFCSETGCMYIIMKVRNWCLKLKHFPVHCSCSNSSFVVYEEKVPQCFVGCANYYLVCLNHGSLWCLHKDGYILIKNLVPICNSPGTKGLEGRGAVGVGGALVLTLSNLICPDQCHMIAFSPLHSDASSKFTTQTPPNMFPIGVLSLRRFWC